MSESEVILYQFSYWMGWVGNSLEAIAYLLLVLATVYTLDRTFAAIRYVRSVRARK